MEYTFYKTKTGEVVGFNTTSKTASLPNTFTVVDSEVGHKEFPHIKEQKDVIEKLKKQLNK